MTQSSSPDLATLVARVERLEREARQLRRVVTASAILGFLVAWSLVPKTALGSGPRPSPDQGPGPVHASAFHLVDADGALRATLGLPETLEGGAGGAGRLGTTPELALLDARGHMRVGLALNLDGVPSLVFPATDEYPGLGIRADPRSGSVELTISTREGRSLAALRGESAAATLTLRRANGAIIFKADQESHPEAR